MKERVVFVLILLTISSYCFILSAENKALLEALYQTDAGFNAFMNKSTGGKKLYEYINPNTVGVFRIEDKNYACGQISTPLPVLRRKK